MQAIPTDRPPSAVVRRQPVGVIDSGVGGISVLHHIRRLLPHEALLYCADSDHAPYGSKTAEFIRARALLLTDFMLRRGAKAIVVACNTATAAAIKALRAQFSVPIIGMEPAVKPAALASKSGVIGVLATSGTLQSARFAALLESYGRDVRVVTQACRGLVERIELGDLTSAATTELLAGYLRPLVAAGADTIVLGCTHYPFVRDLIAAQLGPQVTLIDTGEAVARQLQRRLQAAGLLADAAGAVPDVEFWVGRADDAAYDATVEVIARLWRQGAGAPAGQMSFRWLPPECGAP